MGVSSENPPSKVHFKPLQVITRRKGGGTLIDSRPIFSPDEKYVYVNFLWGVKIFSIKTGECVRVCDAHLHNDKIVDIITHKDQLTALTCKGVFIKWDCTTGTLLSKMILESGLRNTTGTAMGIHLVPNFKKRHKLNLCVSRYRISFGISLSFYSYDGGKKKHPLDDLRVMDDGINHCVAFGGFQDIPIVALITSRRLYVYALDDACKKTKKGTRPGFGREWTCVQCTKEETLVAAGDSTGRVILFSNPLANNGATAIYHWHTLPCRDLAFTQSGSALYTGGGECVLVKWNVENPNHRYFLPRLSGDIIHINVSPTNQYVVVSTLDNSVQIVEASHRLKCVLQQFVWNVLPVSNMKLFPAGIQFDPRSRALILNGRPGHLQFFCPDSEVLLFNVDIALRNYLTQERDKVIVNIEVTNFAVSSDGSWLATIETRQDVDTKLEIRLKFWQFIPSKKCFNLSTSIENPHTDLVHCLLFRPGSTNIASDDEVNLDYMLISTGGDKKFRVWTPSELDGIYNKGTVWGCENACFYREKNCKPASFSDDGSLLAVGFEQTLTVWDMDDIHVKTTITRDSTPLSFVQMGRSEACHLVITCTESELFVWNLLTVSLLWHVPINTSILVPDPLSSYMAVFTTKNTLYVFTPLSTHPVYTSNKLCEKRVNVLSAVFVPRIKELPAAPRWLQHSQLYYIDTNQELIVFEYEGEIENSTRQHIQADKEEGTLFSNLVKAQLSSEVKDEVKPTKHLHFGVLGAKAVSELLKAPAHTMPPVTLLCKNLLKSLAIFKNVKEETEMEISEDEIEPDSHSESSDDSDDEAQRKKQSRRKICKSPTKKMNSPKKKDSQRKKDSPMKPTPSKSLIPFDKSLNTIVEVESVDNLEFFENIDPENFSYK